MLNSAEYAAIKEDYDRISRAYFPRSYFHPDEMSFAKSDGLFPPADLAASIGAVRMKPSAGCFVTVHTRHGTTFRPAFCNFESCCKATFLDA